MTLRLRSPYLILLPIVSSKSVGSWATIPILCRKNSVLVLEVSYPSTSYNTVKAYFCEVHPGWSGFWTEFGSNRKRKIYLPLGRRRYHKIFGAAAYMSTCHSRIDRPKPMFVLLWLKYRIPKVVFIFGLFSLSLRWGLECLAGSGRWTGDFWSECCPGNCPICVLKLWKLYWRLLNTVFGIRISICRDSIQQSENSCGRVLGFGEVGSGSRSSTQLSTTEDNCGENTEN